MNNLNMNLNITQCKNGWLVTKSNHNDGMYYISPNNQPLKPPSYESFVFKTLEELSTWIKTEFVIERLNQ